MPDKWDPVIEEIAHYAATPQSFPAETYDTARLCLFDALGCALLSLKFRECVKRIGPWIPGFPGPRTGTRIPGTELVLDPIQGAFSLGAMIRWLDFNDTWLGQEWGHPSDNLGALLALTDYLSQIDHIPVKNLLNALIKTYEIQGILALSNSFNRKGLDHVMLVRIASTAVSTALLNGSKAEIAAAVSQAFIDLSPLRCYRHAPNTGPRKSWAAGDACARALFLAYQTKKGEPGYKNPLTAPKWGLEAVVFEGKPVTLSRKLEHYVMDNILFKISFPAEFHAQTAAEAAFKLSPTLQNRLDQIDQILIETHEPAMRIINKKGPLHNPADRDHCLQYIIPVSLLKGELKAEYYEGDFSANPLIDALREKMIVKENPEFTRNYYEPEIRSIANSIEIHFKDKTKSEKVTVEFPLGHKQRRKEGVPLIFKKFERNIRTCSDIVSKVPDLLALFKNQAKLESMPVNELIAHFLPFGY